MTARDVFALIVRVAGLALVVLAMFDALHVVMVALGLPDPTPIDQAAAGVFEYGVVGIALIVGARPITRSVYGQGP